MSSLRFTYCSAPGDFTLRALATIGSPLVGTHGFQVPLMSFPRPSSWRRKAVLRGEEVLLLAPRTHQLFLRACCCCVPSTFSLAPAPSQAPGLLHSRFPLSLGTVLGSVAAASPGRLQLSRTQSVLLALATIFGKIRSCRFPAKALVSLQKTFLYESKMQTVLCSTCQSEGAHVQRVKALPSKSACVLVSLTP